MLALHIFQVVKTFIPLALILAATFAGELAWANDSPPAADNSKQVLTEYDGENKRETLIAPDNNTAAANPEAIGSITTNDSFCYQPDTTQNVCYINWRLHSVSSSPDSIRNLKIIIGGKVRLNMQGFFQTSLNYQAAMVSPGGFKVACGPPSVPDPLLGTNYSFQISARDANNIAANNYGTVSCPAFNP